MHRKTLPAKHFFIPVFLLIVALIWGAADIGKSGAITPFSWGKLLGFNGWFEPVTTSAQQTVLINPASFNDIFCMNDGLQCWIAGNNGSLLHTKDTGRIWRPQYSGVNGNLTSIYFPNQYQGWVVGADGTILRTLDAGKTWEHQASGTNNNLNSLVFISPDVGWAVGARGTILHTHDAGKTWEAQTSGTENTLTAVHFSTPELGWVVGDSGIVLHTTDSGRSWLRQVTGTTRDLNAVYFVDDNLGWIVGNEVILHTQNEGATWKEQGYTSGNFLQSVHFITEKSGWASGRAYQVIGPRSNDVQFVGGIFLSTVDGGNSWNYQNLSDSSLSSVTFSSREIGWSVGEKGTIFHTRDGGKNWSQNAERGIRAGNLKNIPIETSQVYFYDESNGWAYGNNGKIKATIDGGKNWVEQFSGTNEDLFDIYFLSPEEGWAVGNMGIILYTATGGHVWSIQSKYQALSLKDVFFLNSKQGWAVGNVGVILSTRDGGASWEKIESGFRKSLNSVYFSSNSEGWVFGDDDTIAHTKDGGKNWVLQSCEDGVSEGNLFGSIFGSNNMALILGNGVYCISNNNGNSWEPLKTPIHEEISNIEFISPKDFRIQCHSGSFYETNDGGATWTLSFTPNQNFYEQLRDTRFGNYYHWPSPLALLLLLISLLWLFISLRTASKNPSDYLPDERGGIADAPVQFLDEDKLSYAPLARGIYKLIRNVDSKPPLAIALSAPWGQGKSSVMNMLHSLLKNDNAVVQFNVWHYRDDGQILAALIEHIRAQAVPSGISLANLRFRWNLLWRRLIAPYWRWWAVVLPIGWLTAWQMGREFDLEWGAIYAHIDQQAHESIKPLSALIGEKFADASPAIGVLLLLLASPLIVKKVLAPLKSFTPAGEASLYSAAWNSFKATLQTTSRDWVEDAGIRFQFQQDFSDICHALGNRKLVLLIDDLDRCDPKQIEQIINTLNFLFSNNMPCYVVMALDWDYVRTALGVAYKDMANALHHKIKVSKGESRAEIFAENYLRKIIQLKVELPDVDVVAAFAEQARLAPEETNTIPVAKLIKKMGSDTLKIFRSAKQAISVNPAHGLDKVVDRLRHSEKINLWDLTKSAGMFFCFLVRALMIEPIGGRVKRHGVNDAYRLGNLIVTVLFACLISTLIVVTLIAVTGNAKSNPAPNIELAEPPTVAAANAQPSPPESVQTQSAKVTTHTSPMLVLDPQKNSAEPFFQLFMIGLGFVGIFWMFWFMRQERDSADFKQALADWKNQLSHKIKTPREWRRLENNLRFFIMLARGYDYLPVSKRWRFFVDKLKARLIAYAESMNYEPPKHFVFDEGVATRLIMADIFREGKVFDQLKVDFDCGGDPRGQLATDWLERGGYTIDEKLTEFFELFMDRSDESAENQVKRWLHLHSFKLQLPYKTGNY